MIEVALTAQVLLWLVVIMACFASGQASMVHPATWYLAFHGLVFVARPLLVCLLDFHSVWQYMGFEPVERHLIRTFTASSLALVVFAAASLWGGRARIGYGPKPPGVFDANQLRALGWVTLALSPVIAYSIYRSNTGGFQGENRGGVFVMTGASGYTIEAQFMATPLLCAWIAVTRFRWMGVLPVAVYVLYRSYFGWYRWTLLLFFLAVALVYCWSRRRQWLPAWMLLLAFPLLLLFHTLGENRMYVRRWLLGQEYRTLSEAGTQPLLEKYRTKYDTLDFANFDFLTYVMAVVPEQTGRLTYGAQYLQLFTEPIPRKLWKGKPVGAPVRLFNLNAYGNFNGLTVSLVGDGWMSGAWVGVVLTVGLFGWIWGRAHAWFWRHSDQALPSLIYLIALAMLPQHLRDGGISIAKYLFWNLSPLLMWAVATWFLGPRWVRVDSFVLSPGEGIRLMESEDPVGATPARVWRVLVRQEIQAPHSRP